MRERRGEMKDRTHLGPRQTCIALGDRPHFQWRGPVGDRIWLEKYRDILTLRSAEETHRHRLCRRGRDHRGGFWVKEIRSSAGKDKTVHRAEIFIFIPYLGRRVISGFTSIRWPGSRQFPFSGEGRDQQNAFGPAKLSPMHRRKPPPKGK